MINRILVVDDEKFIRQSLKGGLEDEGYVVEVASEGISALEKMRKFAPDIVLLDIWMPGEDGVCVLSKIKKADPLVEVIMMSGHGTIETAVNTIKNGAFDFLEKPIHFDKLLLLLTHTFQLKELRRENRFLKKELQGEAITAESDSMKQLLRLIQTIAPSNGWVLIEGEPGTGKDLVARAIHQGSERAKQRFVAVRCHSIDESNWRQELYGCDPTESTDGQRHIGRVEQSDGGTLLLDDVSFLPRQAQEDLLERLQAGSIKRVGADHEIQVDVRVIASTNHDLQKKVSKGEFCEPLLKALGVISLCVPPLRDRKEDIPKLAEHFIRRYSLGRKREISEQTMKMLTSYDWPANVRELKNWVERACLFTDSENIDADRMVVEFYAGRELSANLYPELQDMKQAKSAFEKLFLSSVLREHRGNVGQAAKAVGMTDTHFEKKVRKFGIEQVVGQ